MLELVRVAATGAVALVTLLCYAACEAAPIATMDYSGGSARYLPGVTLSEFDRNIFVIDTGKKENQELNHAAGHSRGWCAVSV